MIAIYTTLFNLILCSGKTPDEWSIGMIKPIFKQKGSSDDLDNYRSITILSCLGKLFTSIINNKLVEYFDEVLPQDTTHLIQRPCYQRGSLCQDPAGNWTTRRPPDIVKRRKLQWYGHVSRSSGLAKSILQGTVKVGRRQGGQRKRWEDNIREWTGLEFGKS